MVSIKVDFKLDKSFAQRLSDNNYEKVIDKVCDDLATDVLKEIRKPGVGKDNPRGGAPVFDGKPEDTSFYPGYLRDSFQYVSNGSGYKSIATSAPYFSSVVYGYRPFINEYSGASFGDAHVAPNPFHKRAVDSSIRNHIIDKSFKKYMDRYISKS